MVQEDAEQAAGALRAQATELAAAERLIDDMVAQSASRQGSPPPGEQPDEI